MLLLAAEASSSSTFTAAAIAIGGSAAAGGAAVVNEYFGSRREIHRARDVEARVLETGYFKHRLAAARLSHYASIVALSIGFGVMGVAAVMVLAGAFKTAAFAGGLSVLAHTASVLFDRTARQNSELLEKAVDRAELRSRQESLSEDIDQTFLLLVQLANTDAPAEVRRRASQYLSQLIREREIKRAELGLPHDRQLRPRLETEELMREVLA